MHMKISGSNILNFEFIQIFCCTVLKERGYNSLISVPLLIKSHCGLEDKNKPLVTKNNALSTSLYRDIKKKNMRAFPLPLMSL